MTTERDAALDWAASEILEWGDSVLEPSAAILAAAPALWPHVADMASDNDWHNELEHLAFETAAAWGYEAACLWALAAGVLGRTPYSIALAGLTSLDAANVRHVRAAIAVMTGARAADEVAALHD